MWVKMLVGVYWLTYVNEGKRASFLSDSRALSGRRMVAFVLYFSYVISVLLLRRVSIDAIGDLAI